jgi:hypothetical protein
MSEPCSRCGANVAPELARVTEKGTLCEACYVSYEADANAAVQNKSRLGRTILGGVGVVALIGFAVAYHFWSGAGLGAPCHRGEDCRSGVCLTTKGDDTTDPFVAGVCTTDCDRDDDCGERFRCVKRSCEPIGTRGFGASCSRAWDCLSNHCIGPRGSAKILGPISIGYYCSVPCGAGGECPDGAECSDVDGARLCARVPKDEPQPAAE